MPPTCTSPRHDRNRHAVGRRLRGLPADRRRAGCTCGSAGSAATSAAATSRRTATRRDTSARRAIRSSKAGIRPRAGAGAIVDEVMLDLGAAQPGAPPAMRPPESRPKSTPAIPTSARRRPSRGSTPEQAARVAAFGTEERLAAGHAALRARPARRRLLPRARGHDRDLRSRRRTAGRASFVVLRRAPVHRRARSLQRPPDPGERRAPAPTAACVRIERADFRRLVTAEPDIGEIIMRAFILRRVGLIRHAQGGVVLIGPAHAADTLRLQRFLTRNGYPHRLLDTELDPDADGFLDLLRARAGRAAGGDRSRQTGAAQSVERRARRRARPHRDDRSRARLRRRRRRRRARPGSRPPSTRRRKDSTRS